VTVHGSKSSEELRRQLAGLIDHTDLRKEITYADVERQCLEARTHGFAAVTVHSVNVGLAAGCLDTKTVRVSAVVGYPFGGQALEVKLVEAARAKEQGATELEMVLNSAAMRAGKWGHVEEELRAFRDVAGEAVAKAILESLYLSEEQVRSVCRLAAEVGLEYVVNSTGFRLISTDPESAGRATVEGVRRLREAAGPRVRVKAVGGIHTPAEVMALAEAGASRIGTSDGVHILRALTGEDAVGLQAPMP
jgi:deoxyribose-phosphate aldolase